MLGSIFDPPPMLDRPGGHLRVLKIVPSVTELRFWKPTICSAAWRRQSEGAHQNYPPSKIDFCDRSHIGMAKSWAIKPNLGIPRIYC